MFSFEIYRVNPLYARTTPFLLIFLSKLFMALEIILLTNPSTLSLAKGIGIFFNDFSLNHINRSKRSTKLNHFRYLRFTKFCSWRHIVSEDITYFGFLPFCWNNLWGSSLSRKFFLVILNIVPVFFFAADFNLFSCVLFRLTLASFCRLL